MGGYGELRKLLRSIERFAAEIGLVDARTARKLGRLLSAYDARDSVMIARDERSGRSVVILPRGAEDVLNAGARRRSRRPLDFRRNE